MKVNALPKVVDQSNVFNVKNGDLNESYQQYTVVETHDDYEERITKGTEH